MKAITCWLPLLLSVVQAADLDPKLAPVAAKYRDEIAALGRRRRDAALAPARASYAQELNAAERLVSPKGDAKAIAAIKQERDALNGASFPATFPADLPSKLRDARNTYRDHLAKAEADILPERKQADADYLRTLGELQAAAAGNAQLTKQLAEEKQRVLTGRSEAAPAGKGSAEPLANGDFDAAAPDRTPEKWKPAYRTGKATVIKESAESFLRVEVTGQPANAGVSQVITIPPDSTSAVVRVRMRGKPANAKSLAAAAQLVFWPRDGSGGNLSATIIKSEHSAGWKTEQRTIEFPRNARTVEISARCVFATGTFDFDDISVRFK